MITIFSNPRSFTGPFKILQYNAIRSWKYLHPDVQIILFEDEEGTTKKVAHELSIQYVEDLSIFLDFKIIMYTFFLVLNGVGVTSKDQEIMPEFMGINASKFKKVTNN